MLKTCFSGGGAIGKYLTGRVARAKQWNVRFETSMLDNASHYNIPHVFHNQNFIDNNRSVKIAPQPVLTKSDGYLVLSSVPGKQLSATIDAAGLPEWRAGIKCIFDRKALTHTFFQRIAQPPKQTITAERLGRLPKLDPLAGPANRSNIHLADPEAIHEEFILNFRHREVPSDRSGNRVAPIVGCSRVHLCKGMIEILHMQCRILISAAIPDLTRSTSPVSS